MATYLSAVSSLDNVIQYEIDDPTQTTGGPGGGANAQAQALLNRTKYIYDNFFNRLTQTLDNIADGTSYKRVQAAKADALNSSTIVAGTIWSSGNDGNGGQPPMGKGKWLDGATSNVNIWTDFVTLPNAKAKYLFLAREPGDVVTYFVSAFIATKNNGTMSMINYDQASTNLQIRIGSGQTLQVYQNADNGAVMQYALIPLTA